MAAWRSRAADHRALQRELDARYAIESRLQCSGGNLRLTMQLIDTESGSALWSSRFVSQLSEIEDSPDQFALSIAIELDQTIGNIECARALAKRPPCTAWEYVLRAVTTMSHHSPGDAQREVDEARRAVAAAPDYGLAHATLARTLSSSLLTNRLIVGDAERRSMIRESHDAVKRAIELDSNSAFVLTILANAYAQLGDAEAGLRLAHRATMLAPNSAEAHFALGFCNFMLGRSAETIEAFGNQDRIGLSDNARMAGQSLLGICLFIEGKSAEAEAAIDSSLTLQPTSYLAIRWKAIVAAELGKDESARAAIRRLRESEPGKSIEEYLDSPRHLPIEHPRKYEAIEILRKLLEETAGC
jgi:Flp pilus assembly protein TadD